MHNGHVSMNKIHFLKDGKMKINLFVIAGINLLIGMDVALAEAMQTTTTTTTTVAPATNTSVTATTTAKTAEPCSDMVNMCRGAGFVDNGPAGKGIWNYCMPTLMSGKTVGALTATPQQIEACRTDMSNQPCVKLLNQCSLVGFTGGYLKLPFFDCLVPYVQGKYIAGLNPTPAEFNACKTYIETQIRDQPCFRVMLACKAGGYSPDAMNGELFARNCFNVLLAGQTVKGVTLDPNDGIACRNQTQLNQKRQ